MSAFIRGRNLQNKSHYLLTIVHQQRRQTCYLIWSIIICLKSQNLPRHGVEEKYLEVRKYWLGGGRICQSESGDTYDQQFSYGM
mmetsp:Transcript_39022/g.82056  ORF Transcript_39022/g.82056 Transcript_39022/m.82056 type:complete len:84 (+) Transcript_39022:582-833(+)